MKNLLFAVFIITAYNFSCKKNDNSGNSPQPETVIDTVGRMWVDPLIHASGSNLDTTGNFIAQYSFYQNMTSSRLATYDASSSGTYRIRYVATLPLFHSDSVSGRGGQIIGFKINPALRGRPLFEAYEVSTGRLYKTYIASQDSVPIYIPFSIFDNYAVPNKKIGDAILYCIGVKQHDGILYRKN